MYGKKWVNKIYLFIILLFYITRLLIFNGSGYSLRFFYNSYEITHYDNILFFDDISLLRKDCEIFDDIIYNEMSNSNVELLSILDRTYCKEENFEFFGYKWFDRDCMLFYLYQHIDNEGEIVKFYWELDSNVLEPQIKQMSRNILSPGTDIID